MTFPLSRDHATTNADEARRLVAEQSGRPVIDAKSGRVKGICAFTRSLGDFQMKDAAAGQHWNARNERYRIEQ
eukprot:COSAG01_NODE_64146_length_277_cov_1.196629_1_plen_72_part_10